MFTIALLSLISIATASAPHAQSAGVKRVLMRRATTVPGYGVVVRGRNSPADVRRHTHPERWPRRTGTVTLDYAASPRHAGASFVDAGKIHEGMNNGNVTAKIRGARRRPEKR